MSKALVVLSGGQDSTTCLFWAIQQFGIENVHAVTFNYGQRHAIELEAARKVAEMAHISDRHEIVDVPGILRSSSPLLSSNELERYKDAKQMAEVVGDRVEKTFVPLRNSFFLVVAANYALAAGCDVLVTGICQEDNANYPDCTESFRFALEHAINVSLDNNYHTEILRIEAPLMDLTKAETVLLAESLPGCWKALAYSHTSYDGKYPPTDMNHANVLRAKGFEEANRPDPLVVRAYREGLMELPGTANYDGVERNVDQ